ncbi:MAG: multicopper oxidase domain-containing protein [Pseudomonadota bacterium]
MPPCPDGAPTLRRRRGWEVNLHYQNTLDEGVAMHLHGVHVTGDVSREPAV